MTIVAEKTVVRAAALAERAAVGAATRRVFAARLAESGRAVMDARTRHSNTVVSLYHPIRGEADTGLLIEALTRSGIRTALPRTLGRGQPLQFHLWRPGDAVAPGPWDIVEPLADAPLVDPDVLFVPLAAFDRHGYRLGYGGGFYDSALAALRRSKPILAVGVAFGAQEVERVPREPHDQRLDAVITEDETLLFGAD